MCYSNMATASLKNGTNVLRLIVLQWGQLILSTDHLVINKTIQSRGTISGEFGATVRHKGTITWSESVNWWAVVVGCEVFVSALKALKILLQWYVDQVPHLTVIPTLAAMMALREGLVGWIDTYLLLHTIALQAASRFDSWYLSKGSQIRCSETAGSQRVSGTGIYG